MPEYYDDVESAVEAAVEREVPRTYALLKMEASDQMEALIEGQEEQLYHAHVELFDPNDRVVFNVDTEQTSEGWTAEVV